MKLPLMPPTWTALKKTKASTKGAFKVLGVVCQPWTLPWTCALNLLKLRHVHKGVHGQWTLTCTRALPRRAKAAPTRGVSRAVGSSTVLGPSRGLTSCQNWLKQSP
ncbi:hypothetical protein KY285_010979 [Solanum tuberosum]|nr:hypothetical protein KY285_010979 [Solanum tuberosum]